MNEELLLSNTEFPKDHIENILHIDPSEQPAQGIRRHPQILSSQFLALADGSNAALQRSRGLLQQLSLPLPSNQAVVAEAEIILREPDQGGNQLPDPIAPARRDAEIRTALPLRQHCARRDEIDLVAHPPHRRCALVRNFFVLRI